MSRRDWHTVLESQLTRRRFLTLVASVGAGVAALACSGDDDAEDAGPSTPSNTPAAATMNPEPTSAPPGEVTRPAGWTEASHSNDAEPDYDIVFPKDRVNQITFTVTPEHWQSMLDDMTELAGERGTRGEGKAGDFFPRNPKWAPVTVSFKGLEWTKVGLRFKGNSSLRSGWSSGTDKLPLKLDFDEFEDDYPEIKNQRFYGFKQLSLSNNWMDPAAMRESVAYDLLEEAGLVAAETGFYEVILDHGEGAKSLGLYTVIEVVDDTVIERYFEDHGGNIYEAEGNGASFASGTNDQIESSFQVESDEDQADWSDIHALYDVLHSDLRSQDPAAWRASLEDIFGVDTFLEWLALSALLKHWDAYGGMSHNYYLYNDPETGILNWISWDHNLVLDSQNADFGPGSRQNVGFDKSGVGEEWPLIGYLLAQPEYLQKYNAYLRELLDGTFAPANVVARIRQRSPAGALRRARGQ